MNIVILNNLKIMEQLTTEDISCMFTKRIGVLSVVLTFFGYAHQGVHLVKFICKASRKLLADYPFESVLKAVRFKHEVFETGISLVSLFL